MTVEFRVLRTADELAVMPDFEELVWGGEDDRVSVNMLVAVVVEGGVAIAGFDGDTVVATAFGFPHPRCARAALALHGRAPWAPTRRPG